MQALDLATAGFISEHLQFLQAQLPAMQHALQQGGAALPAAASSHVPSPSL